MTKPAAIDGDYVDLKFIKGRKVAQIHIEIPIEAASKFVEVFGTPLPDRTIPVAIARLNTGLKEQLRESVEHEKSKRNWNELSRAQQAGIACGEKGFWRFLFETYTNGVSEPIETAGEAATAVRLICQVQSRREFDERSEAGKSWDSCYSNYRLWLQAPDVAA